MAKATAYHCRLYKTKADFRNGKVYPGSYYATTSQALIENLKDPHAVPGTVFPFEVVQAIPLIHKTTMPDPSKPQRIFVHNRTKYIEVFPAE